MVISAFGRAHAKAKKAVHWLAVAAARRYGETKASRIEDGWWRNCGTLLMERPCTMVSRCRPTVPLPTALGGVADDLAEVRPAKRQRRAADAAPAVGADGPTAPAEGGLGAGMGRFSGRRRTMSTRARSGVAIKLLRI